MDPAKMKVVDLRSELGALGLDTKGNKPALVERLKKALESKSGKAIPDSSILDTSTEEAEEPPTPRRGPAARTTRRSSSSRLCPTPAKIPRENPPKVIKEEEQQKHEAIQKHEPVKVPEKEAEPVTEPVSELVPEPIAEPIGEPIAEPIAKPASEPIAETASEPIAEQVSKPTLEKIPEPVPESIPDPESVSTPLEPVSKETEVSQPLPVPAPVPEPVSEPVSKLAEPEPLKQKENSSVIKEENQANMYNIDDDLSQSPIEEKQNDEGQETEVKEKSKQDENQILDVQSEEKCDEESKDEMEERKELYLQHQRDRVLTEEEEWDLLNERLVQKEQERIEREKKQAEEDAKKIEEISKDPVKFQRLKRKQEKKSRWTNFYKSVEVTNQVLAPPTEEPPDNKQKEEVETVTAEPELDDSKITLSWYDSDLNQYLELPELTAVVPLSDGAFAHAWAGARASHGAARGRLCYEVRMGSTVTTTETAEKENLATGLRVGWSTDDASLHLGEDALSWGYESTGRAVNNSEFKEYGQQVNEKDVIGAYLDLDSQPCKISYTLNGVELGTAFEFEKETLDGKALFPHVLTKNMCYRVNMGYDRYNMLTKTKIVRKRVEIPIEQVLEEKRKSEEQMKQQKEEAQRKSNERRDNYRWEREDRQYKKKEDIQKPEDKEEEMEVDSQNDIKTDDKNTEDTESDRKETEEKMETDEQINDCKIEPTENGSKPEEVTEEKAELAEDKESESDAKEELKEEASELLEVTEEQVMGGLVLDKRIKFVTRYTVEEELENEEAFLLPGYEMISKGELVAGPRRPNSCGDCEVILMVGMPGSGKTYWAKQHCKQHPERRYNILSTGALFDRMKIDCKPIRTTYDGKWDVMVSKCAKCVLKLLEIAKGRRRNFILDQTNVYPSAQRRKLREFPLHRRVAAACVCGAELQRGRAAAREARDGKEVPDAAVLDMKANFTLPERGSMVDEVIYTELNEEESKKVLESYHAEAAAAGAVKEKDRRARSASRDAPARRQRSPERSRDRRRSREHTREREDRWSGRPAPQRRNLGRDRPHQGGGGGRFERTWPQRNYFGRDREGGGGGFRGGRGGGGGQGGPRQDRGPGGPGGAPGGPGGPGGPGAPGTRGPPGDRFQRDNRPQNRGPPHQPDKRLGGPPPGAGSWQRGSSRGGAAMHGPRQDNQNQNHNQNQNWNQWSGGWGGWGNWNNQNQGWNNWNNWGGSGPGGGSSGAGKGPAGHGPGWQNYNAQQWQQWHQWQQWQQQQWQGYGQQQQQQQQQPQQQGGANNAENAQAWAQFYQNYGAGNNGNTNTAVEKK